MRNVVLVTVDSLRADICSGANGEQLAPNIVQLGRDGVEFSSAIAPGPRTPSSVPAFLTGEFYCTEEEDMPERRAAIRSHIVSTETLPERFSAMGYNTLGFSLNPWTAADTGFETIFDEFHELTPDAESDIDVSPAVPGGKFIDKTLQKTGKEHLFNWKNRREWFSHWSTFRNDLFDRISSASEPYFVWIFLMDTHQPTIVPWQYRDESSLLRTLYAVNYFTQHRGEPLPERIDKWIQQSYRDAVRSVDEFVGQLSDELGSEDMLAVHSDHGEAWGDHGINGHEYQLYEENIRVPLVIRHPDVTEEITENFTLLDLPDLLVELAEISNVCIEQWGRNVVPTMVESEEAAQKRCDTGGYNPHYRALRGKRFKLIETRDEELLFDLHKDPNEQRNVCEEYPEMREAFKQLLDSYSRKREEKRRIVERITETNLQSY